MDILHVCIQIDYFNTESLHLTDVITKVCNLYNDLMQLIDVLLEVKYLTMNRRHASMY